MIIKFTTVTVNNLDESLRFYQDVLGFKEVKRFSPQTGVNIVFLKDEETGIIELIEHQNTPKNDMSVDKPSMSIGIGVVDLERTVEDLRIKGVEPIQGIIEVSTGEKFIFIRDPNGVEIELIQGFKLPK